MSGDSPYGSGGPYNPPPIPPGQNPYADWATNSNNPYAVGQPVPASPADASRNLQMLVPVGRTPWALAAGYLGLFCLCLTITAPLAVFCGVMGLKAIKKDPKLLGAGRCWFGIVMGSIVSLLVVIGITFYLFALFSYGR